MQNNARVGVFAEPEALLPKRRPRVDVRHNSKLEKGGAHWPTDLRLPATSTETTKRLRAKYRFGS